jgi:hypothetical protein
MQLRGAIKGATLGKGGKASSRYCPDAALLINPSAMALKGVIHFPVVICMYSDLFQTQKPGEPGFCGVNSLVWFRTSTWR